MLLNLLQLFQLHLNLLLLHLELEVLLQQKLLLRLWIVGRCRIGNLLSFFVSRRGRLLSKQLLLFHQQALLLLQAAHQVFNLLFDWLLL